MDSHSELETRLAKLVAVVTDDARSCLFSIGQFRRDTAKCLSMMRKDLREHGGTGEERFWNLVMYDEYPDERAMFIVTVFAPQVLRIYVGLGFPHTVLEVCNRFSMAEADAMEGALRDDLHAADKFLDVPRSLAEYWLANV
jgi:hypothetical protein